MKDNEHIRAFLYRSIYNRSLNVLKHRSVIQEYAESVTQLDAERAVFYHPDNNEIIGRIENRDLRQEINAAISELPDKCQKVFVMSYIHEMKNKEIADLLNISVKTVEVHMYKALKFLRKRLEYLTFIFLLFSLPK